jgi:hypothetical protein
VKLQDRLPDSVRINGKRYAADFDFRNVLRMMDILGDKNLTDEAREWLAVKCVMKKPVKGALDAIRKILFGADKEDEQEEDDGTRLTSFDQDAALIRAAFWQTYRINLYTEKLHWLAFLELLRGLPEGTRYMEVVGIRAKPMPAPTKYNTEERQWLQKAKARYAVKQTEEETARNYDRGVQKVFAGLMGMIKG